MILMNYKEVYYFYYFYKKFGIDPHDKVLTVFNILKEKEARKEPYYLVYVHLHLHTSTEKKTYILKITSKFLYLRLFVSKL